MTSIPTIKEFRSFASGPLTFEPVMSDAEALMWQVEKDPWLDPSGSALIIMDGPADFEVLRQRMTYAVGVIARLRQRVVPGLAPFSPPRWEPDPEFNLDYHLRHIHLPAPGTRRQLFDLAALLHQDPLDRTRPLWRFYLIDGVRVEGTRRRGSVLVSKMHHTIADGIAAIRLAELYMDLTAEPDDVPEVDLDAIIAADVSAHDTTSRGRIPDAVGHNLRRQGGRLRRILAETATWGADPLRPITLGQQAAATLRQALDELGIGEMPDVERSPDDGTQTVDANSRSSPLWRERSRHRHLESVNVELDAVKAVATAHGATINDVFVAAVADASIRYHLDEGVTLDTAELSYVVSTRSRAISDSDAVSGNAWTPTKISVPADGALSDRIQAVHRHTAARNANRRSMLQELAGLATALPTSVLTTIARQQAASIDIATSNLRAAPFETFIGGARVTECIAMGPVAGTAANITTMSYNGRLMIGICADPIAITNPARLATHLHDTLHEAIAQLDNPG